MALTKIAGVGGTVALPTGFNGHFRSFDWNLSFPEAETTGFLDLGFASFVPVGGIRCTGSVQGVLTFDAAATQPFPDAFADGSGLGLGDLAGLTGTTTLTYTTGCTLAFSANITGLGGNRPENGVGECAWQYGSTGPLTVVWDEVS